MTRREKVILILGSLYDLLPAPRGALRTESGLAPAERRPCPDCGHTEHPGNVVDRFKRREPCTTCGGRLAEPGVRSKRGRGWVTVDPMDSEQQALRTATTTGLPTKPARVVTCDACGGWGVGKPHLDENGNEWRARCERCNGSGHRTVASGGKSEGAREDEDMIERRGNAGSYLEMDRALASLRLVSPRLWALVTSTYVVGEIAAGSESARLTLGLAYLEARMPATIRVPSGVIAASKNRAEQLRRIRGRGSSPQALALRDKEIRRHARAGRARQWIAGEYGLSVSQVGRIVNGEREAA